MIPRARDAEDARKVTDIVKLPPVCECHTLNGLLKALEQGLGFVSLLCILEDPGFFEYPPALISMSGVQNESRREGQARNEL
jgi:hypothetical protein